MKKHVWPLIVVLLTIAGVWTVEYVKIARERGRLLGQLREVAAVVSAHPPDSTESRAAMERGTMIVVAWPCHWWEDRQAVRSKATEIFENMIALNRRNDDQADTLRPSAAPAENH